jgi:hypothetical protein
MPSPLSSPLNAPDSPSFVSRSGASSSVVETSFFLISSLTLFLLYVLAFIRNAWICDDAYITFRTVDNFIQGYGLRWNIQERVQTYTHPLWMFLLSLGLLLYKGNLL